jgi:SAM-dependent methyltransferase
VHPDDARLAAWNRVYERYLVVEDIYPTLATRILAGGAKTFAEVGGGRGPIAEALKGRHVATCVVDRDEQMLAAVSGPAARADLLALPFADESLDAVAAVNCLYFLDDPVAAIREAWRVLRPGGVFVASSPSRFNDPELADIDPKWATPSTFDAEDSPQLVAKVFSEVEVEPWRLVAYVLPDQSAIADYLHAFNVQDWERKAKTVTAPMSVTKVGAEVWATK